MATTVYEWDAVSKMVIDALQPAIAALDSLSFIGHATHIVKLPQVDAMIQPTADSLGMQLALFKYTIGLFLVYPFAAILYSLPNKHLKHLFSFLGGFFLVQWIFGPDWIHTFASSMITYLLCFIVPRKYLGNTAFLFVMGYMVVAHIYRMYTSYLSGEFDFTGTQMVLTMKLTSFANNLQDGTADYKQTFKREEDYPAERKRDYRVMASRQRFALTEGIPSPLAFLGYIYCFTCLLAGPAFEYKDYERSIDDSAFVVPGSSQIKRPSTLFPSLQRLVVGIVFMVGYLLYAAQYPLTMLYDPSFIARYPYTAQRFGGMFIAMVCERFKYYFAWKVAEGASILAGFGFEGYAANKDTGKVEAKGWKGVENIDIIGFETAPNIASSTRTWNKRTQGWLERYSYLRSNKSLVYTYLVSSLWHGLYPGFFAVFLSMPLFTEVERLLRKKINPFFCPGYEVNKPASYPKGMVAQLYWLLCNIGTVCMLSYVAQCFSMGSWVRCQGALGSLYYGGHGILIVLYGLLTIMPGVNEGKEGGKGKKQESEARKESWDRRDRIG